MPQAKVNDVSLHYQTYGAGDPLLLIMGLGASSAAWEPSLVEELARDFRVITFDNRGTGQSDKPDIAYSIAMFAADAAGLLDHLAIGRAHLFGVSMGGMIAQKLALGHAGRTHTLTLGCTTAGGKHAVPPPPESLAILTAPREGVSPEEVIRRGWPLGYPAEYIAGHRAELEAAIPRLLEHPTPPYAFKRQYQATMTLHIYDRLDRIKAPTLVIAGLQDCLIPPRNSEIIAARIPGAKLHLIANAGHVFWAPGRVEFLSVFVPFLKQHPIG